MRDSQKKLIYPSQVITEDITISSKLLKGHERLGSLWSFGILGIASPNLKHSLTLVALRHGLEVSLVHLVVIPLQVEESLDGVGRFVRNVVSKHEERYERIFETHASHCLGQEEECVGNRGEVNVKTSSNDISQIIVDALASAFRISKELGLDSTMSC